MAEQILEQIQDDVLVLTLNNPPFNFLSAPLRALLLDRLEAGFADASVQGIVLAGEGALFSTGVPVAEYERALAAPWLSTICARIEEGPKPVVVALHGLVLSGAFELALAAHGRVAHAAARVGLPDVTLGLPPGAGGSQRLTRLAGPDAALKLTLSGKLAQASDLAPTRIFQQVVTGEGQARAPVIEAIALAQKFAKAKRWKRTRDVQIGLREPQQFQELLAQTRRGLPRETGVQHDIVACIEAAQLLPLEQGLNFEAMRFADRLKDPRGRAERHLAAAREAASVEATLARSRPKPVAHVALVGGARRIADAATLALSLNKRASILTGDEAHDAAIRTDIEAQMAQMVAAGTLEPAQRDARLARLAVLSGPEALETADLVVDTGRLELPETLAQKPGAIWVMLDHPGQDMRAAIARRKAMLGDEAALATLCMRRPMTPAPLAEISVLSGPQEQVAATLTLVLTTQERSVLVVHDLPGGIIGTMRACVARAGLVMLAAGVPFEAVEAAARGLGFARGPFQMIDATGAAQTLALARHVYDARGASIRPFRLLSDRLADTTDISQGSKAALARALAFHVRAGQSGEAGKAGNALARDPGLNQWLEEWRGDTRDETPEAVPDWPKDIAPERALQAAIINEAARMLEGGHVRRAGDIDMAMVTAAGFEAQRGGPLMQADGEALVPLLRSATRLAEIDPVLWQPVPLLADMVKNGRRFF